MNSGGITNSNGFGYNKYETNSFGCTEWKNQDTMRLYVELETRYNTSSSYLDIPLKHLSRPSQVYTYYLPVSIYSKDKGEETCFCLTIAVDAKEAKKLGLYPARESTKIIYPENGNPYSFFEFRFDKLESARRTRKIIEEQKIIIFDTLEQKIVKNSSIHPSPSKTK